MRSPCGALISAVVWVRCGSLCTWLSLQREHREVGMDGGEIMKESQIPVLCVQCQLFLFVRHLVRHFARLSHSVKPKDSGY